MERFSNNHNISDTEREAFVQALTAYYSGKGTIRQAFDAVERGLIDRYYRRKKSYPDEIADIDRAAQAAAGRERSSAQLAFEARQERDSMDIQSQARAMVLELIAELGRIARGEPRVVWDEVEQQEKVLIAYPRDQIAAFKALLEVARHGVMWKDFWKSLRSPGETETEDKHQGGLLPVFAAASNFKRLKYQDADGRTVIETVGEDDVVYEDEEDDDGEG